MKDPLLFIPRDEFESRQETGRKKAREAGLDAIVVIGGPFYDRPGDLAYLTGHYPPFPSVNFHHGYRGLGFGIFVLPVSGKSLLVTDTQAYRPEFVVSDEVRAAKNLPFMVRSSLREMGYASARLGIVGLEVASWAMITEIGFPDICPADAILRAMRRRKSRNEIALLRRAAEVAEIGIAAAQGAVSAGRTEGEVCGEGVRVALAAGADFVRYLRVLSGPYGGLPHRWPPSTERIMREGETVCMDFIGAVKGYQFDILRTSFVGSPSEVSKRLVELAACATEAAIMACGPGVPVREVIRAADAVIEGGGYLEWRARFTGHGIGLDTVEAPFIMAESDDTLEVGDTICLEPGILVRDVHGARFEYEVVITETGCELLAHPKYSPS
jgi:Xaa-Pro aminopeptidase